MKLEKQCCNWFIVRRVSKGPAYNYPFYGTYDAALDWFKSFFMNSKRKYVMYCFTYYGKIFEIKPYGLRNDVSLSIGSKYVSDKECKNE